MLLINSSLSLYNSWYEFLSWLSWHTLTTIPLLQYKQKKWVKHSGVFWEVSKFDIHIKSLQLNTCLGLCTSPTTRDLNHSLIFLIISVINVFTIGTDPFLEMPSLNFQILFMKTFLTWMALIAILRKHEV